MWISLGRKTFKRRASLDRLLHSSNPGKVYKLSVSKLIHLKPSTGLSFTYYEVYTPLRYKLGGPATIRLSITTPSYIPHITQTPKKNLGRAV